MELFQYCMREALKNPDSFIPLDPFSQKTLGYLKEYEKALTLDIIRKLEASRHT